MIEVKIDGIQINLMSQHRVVLLKEVNAERYLMIWVGPFEAEAINVELQQVDFPRPLTHDLLKSVIEALHAAVERVIVTELRNDTFFAQIILSVDGRTLIIDSRPSDAMALAVRVRVPIYVAEKVMAEAGIVPEPDLGVRDAVGDQPSALDDFIGGLDIDDLPIH
jgi:bifunctional DNase/RNase